MSDTHDTHGTKAPDQHASPHAAADEHGHGGHDGGSLGPVDWRMWGVGALGVVAALLVTAGVVVATGFAFNA
jgi:hypothetical protein